MKGTIESSNKPDERGASVSGTGEAEGLEFHGHIQLLISSSTAVLQDSFAESRYELVSELDTLKLGEIMQRQSSDYNANVWTPCILLLNSLQGLYALR